MGKIGHARGDENGNIVGGKAGDQTKNEVSITEWYLHKKGWDVLRAKNAKVAEKIAKCMEDACANNNIGYDQTGRLTLYNAVDGNGFKCDSKSLTKKVETDCSALVRVCCAYAGVKLPNFSTADEKSVLLDSGRFELKNIGGTDDYLKRGDILVTKTKGHTVVVLTDGEKARKHTQKQMAIDSAKNYAKTLAGEYKATADVNCRTGAGTTKKIMCTIPKGHKVKCFGYYTQKGRKWLYVQFVYKGVEYTGFISSKYLKKA